MIAKGKRLFLTLGVGVVCIALALPFLPERWLDRQQTTLSYEQDRSAMSRIDNWTFCWRLAVDRPIVGGGFSYFTRETLSTYAPEFLLKYNKVWDSHSIYFGVLAAHGFPGLALFLGMIFVSLLSCRNIRHRVAETAGATWATNYCHMVELSLLALLVNGAFVNMEYFDLPYHLAGVVACLRVLVARDLARLEVDARACPAPAPTLYPATA
jgi:probable O-glycosylation ligase (exosortase A-associated)